ncbi:MAG TPA: type II secretion system protein [Terriglobales bacterium]|nr:type II secretion system protein [Terriglobales bacterium]
MLIENKTRFSATRVNSCEGAAMRGNYARGFSLIELVIVMAVMLVLAALTTPITLNTMDAYKLRGSMSGVSGLAQRCRLLALQKNTTSHMYFTTSGGAVTMYCKINSDTSGLQTSDPQLSLDTKFSIGSTPTTALSATTMWGSSGSTFSANSDPYFNSRGLPCSAPSAGAACSTINGYVYYFKYSSHTTRWSAISVSPAARMQNWYWNASSWGN